MQDQEKKTLNNVLVLLITFLVIIIIVDYLFFCGLIGKNQSGNILIKSKEIFFKLYKQMYLVRFTYIGLLAMMVWLTPRLKIGRNMTKKDKIKYQILAVISSLVFIYGFTPIYYYNLIIYPILLLVNILLVTRAIAALRKTQTDEDFFGKISSIKKEFCFEFPTDKGILRIHSPEQHIFADAGPGGGKSQNVVKPIIKQCAANQWAMVIYDYKGDPREKGLPDLCNTAYAAVLNEAQKAKDKGIPYNLKFAFINFVDLSKSVRINVLSDKYMTGFLDIKALSVTLFKNLSKTSKDKQDFWSEYGTSYIYGVAYKIWKDRKINGFCSLPHVISACLSNIDTVFGWLSQDPDIEMLMSPLIGAYKKNASGQLAGGTSTGQLPLASLFERNLYWVLSADETQEFDLDISRQDNRCMLGIANTKKVEEAITPVISVILALLTNILNTAGREPAVFVVDEVPTVFINGLDQTMATIRSNKVCVVLTVQDFQQLERDYGKQTASILRTTCGSFFQGMTTSGETAKWFSDFVGDIDKTKMSYTDNEGSGSETESKHKEKIIQPRDIGGQATGHFMGKIADGRPPFFSVQFDYIQHEKKEIPPFAITHKTGNDLIDKEILDKLVEANFNKINNEIRDLLAPFIPET